MGEATDGARPQPAYGPFMPDRPTPHFAFSSPAAESPPSRPCWPCTPWRVPASPSSSSHRPANTSSARPRCFALRRRARPADPARPSAHLGVVRHRGALAAVDAERRAGADDRRRAARLRPSGGRSAAFLAFDRGAQPREFRLGRSSLEQCEQPPFLEAHVVVEQLAERVCGLQAVEGLETCSADPGVVIAHALGGGVPIRDRASAIAASRTRSSISKWRLPRGSQKSRREVRAASRSCGPARRNRRATSRAW